MSLDGKLATVDFLNEQILAELFNGGLMAVRVPQFYDMDRCKSLSDLLYRAIEERPAAGGIYDSDIDSFWSAVNDEDRRARYFAAAMPLHQKLRAFSAPHPSPIDLLRLALDEAWPGGATLMSLAGAKMPFGITRLWRTGSEALPHQDVLGGKSDRTMKASS